MFNGVNSIDVITFCVITFCFLVYQLLTLRACVPHKPLQRQLRHNPAISTLATTVESREDL